MRLWNRQSISGRLTRVNLLVSGIALLIAYASFLAYDLYTSRQGLISALGTEAAIVSANSVTALVFDQQAAETTLAALRGSPHVVSAVIVGEDGTVFAQYFRDPSAQPVVRPPLEPSKSWSYWSKGRNILFGRRIMLGNKSVGTVYLLAETTDVIRRAARFGLISACILLLCFVTAVLATATIRHLVTEPLTDLAETAQIVTRNRDYSVRARLPRSANELSFLVQSFNEMLVQIQERDRALEESRTVLEQRVQERTAELSAANQELEAFSYSVAHDLRGPLQHITNIGFLLQQACITGEDSNGAALIEKLFEGTNRMSKLIDDLVNLSRATSAPVHRTAIDLSDVAASILATLQAEDPERLVRLIFAKGALVNADEGLLRQAMENLLRNAWKYTARREGAEIEFGFTEEPAGTVYSIRDNGVGFDPRYTDRLFRPFQRLHSQSDFPGTGVGLATVHRIITRHGGRIWAQGNVDRGAEFSFTLPNQAES
jgi:signal transduction histidine kinase